MIIHIEVEAVAINGQHNLPATDIIRYINASVDLALTLEQRADLAKLGWKVVSVTSGEA